VLLKVLCTFLVIVVPRDGDTGQVAVVLGHDRLGPFLRPSPGIERWVRGAVNKYIRPVTYLYQLRCRLTSWLLSSTSKTTSEKYTSLFYADASLY
jgi:hypothetical protein